MRIIFDVNHAGHVHFIKNAYKILQSRGHDCHIVASDKPLVYDLLDEYNLPYYPMGSIGITLFAKFWKLIKHDLKLLWFCIKNKPDVILGIVAIRGSHVSKLLRFRSIVFTDTEHAKKQIALFKPFASEIHTPNWFTTDIGKKQIRYNGFHELAYLHPNHFTPRDNVFNLLGLNNGDPFFILRFVAWDATHDKNQYGLTLDTKRALVRFLSTKGKVFISSEYPLEDEFTSMAFQIPFSYLHDALFYADFVISEGATTACESAILGVPTIYVNSLRLGYMSYLEDQFQLLYNIQDKEVILERVTTLLSDPNVTDIWMKRKSHFLSTQIDTTDYIIKQLLKEDR